MKTFCNDMPEAQQKALFERLMAGKNTKSPAAYDPKALGSVLSLLQHEEDARSFQQLKDAHDVEAATNLVLERFGYSRGKALATTPNLLKALKPPIKGACVVWQPSREAYEGYYPKLKNKGVDNAKGRKVQTHHSTSRSYGGGKHTAFDALRLVVQRLWKWHKSYKKDSQAVICLLAQVYSCKQGSMPSSSFVLLMSLVGLEWDRE